jgi:hypothetical protein
MRSRGVSPFASPADPPQPLDEFQSESTSERAFSKDSTPFKNFLSEHRAKWSGEPETAPVTERPRFYTVVAVGIGLLVGVVVSAALGVPRFGWPVSPGGGSPVVITDSTVTLTSLPEDAAVYIDGAHAGQTPLSLSLPVGMHVAELRSGTMSRRAPLSVEAGKIADIVGVPGDPVADVHTLEHVSFVMKEGVIYKR